MRTTIWLSFALLVAVASAAQTPAPAPRPAQPAPAAPAAPAPAAPAATPAPARRPAPAPAPASRAGIAMTVTDPSGLPIGGVHVSIAGLSDRSGDTNDNGQINFVGMQAGTYRALFEGAKVKPFEKEVTVVAGKTTMLDVTLNAAPPPPAAPPPSAPPAAAAAPVGPVGAPQMAAVPELLGRDFIGKMPRRETLLSCSGNERTMMIQLNDPLPDRLYDNADVAYYVIGGQGTAKIAGRETMIDTNAFLSVPRGTAHSFTRRGNRPLILLAVLSGEPCEQAK